MDELVATTDHTDGAVAGPAAAARSAEPRRAGSPSPVGRPDSLPVPSGRAPRGSRGCGGVVLGSILVLVGIPMLICPGPGMAVILAGLGMIGVGLGLKKADR